MSKLITTTKALKAAVAAASKHKMLSVDTETTSTNPVTCTPVGLVLAYGTASHYIPFGHKTDEEQLTQEVVVKHLWPLLEGTTPKVFHNAAYDLVVLRRMGLPVGGRIEDTMLMSYALEGQKNFPRGHGFDALVKEHFDHESIRFGDVVKGDYGVTNFSEIPYLMDAAEYATEDAEWTLKLYYHLKRLLKDAGLLGLYQKIDRPLVPILADMKLAGLKVDRAKLSKLGDDWRKERDKIHGEVMSLVGDINLASPKKVKELLYTTLKLEPPGGLDPEDASTGKEALTALGAAHPVVPLILRHKEYDKLLSSFVDAWPEHLTSEDKLHGNFNPCVTATGRFSGSEPNLQQVPTRTDNGVELRRAIVAEPGFKIIAADYSQIEYRILAHVTGAPYLLKAYQDGVDLHALMAADVRGGKWEDYNNKKDAKRYAVRTAFKNVNFAVIYGAGPKKVAAMSKITEADALKILASHKDLVPEVYEWKLEVVEFAHKHKYSETLFGRRIHVPRIGWSDYGIRGHAERLSVNGAIQGTAADLMRLAIPAVDRAIGYEINARPVATVHDELLVYSREEFADLVVKYVKTAMETCADHLVQWRVPIIAEAGIGDNWKEAK